MTVSAYTLAAEFTALVAVWVVLGVWQRGPGVAARIGPTCFCAAVILWACGTVLQDRATAAPDLANSIRLLGLMTLPVAWFALGLWSSGTVLSRSMPQLPLFFALPTLLLWTASLAGPWAELLSVTGGDGLVLRGPLWRVFGAGSLLLSIWASWLFLRGARDVSGSRRTNRRTLALGGLLATAVALVHDQGLLPGAADPTPILLVPILFALRSGVVGGGLLVTVPVSQRDLMRALPIGIVVADPDGVITEINPSALDRLGVSREEALGRALDALLLGLAADQRAELQAIYSAGEMVGVCAVVTSDGSGDRDRSDGEARAAA